MFLTYIIDSSKYGISFENHIYNTCMFYLWKMQIRNIYNFYGDFPPFFTILYSLYEYVVLFTDIAILKVYTM